MKREARSQDTENQLEQIGHQDASLRRPLAASTPTLIFDIHRPFEEPDRGEWVQTKSLAPYWGFFSNGHIAGHERKFRQDFKDIFSELYREFESRLVRQQVIDIAEAIWTPANYATFPKVSGRIRESSKLRARITAIFFNQLGQFSEGHFASAVLVAMMARKVDVTVQFWRLFSVAARVLRLERVMAHDAKAPAPNGG